MSNLVEDHRAHVRQILLTGYSLKNRAKWITDHTYLRRARYSFKDHEFQREIVECEAQEIVTRKCAQIGLSETQARDALAMVNVMPGFTVIYTLPTAAFSKTFARTRVDPVIEASEYLRKRLNTNVDSGEVKQFGDSFIYFRGTRGMTAAISVPADCLVHDEYDFSDLKVLSSYQSRLAHSPFKLKRKFSTPTVNGWGISAEFDASRQRWNMAKCNHCSQWFLPEYEKQVRVPGWDKELREIKEDNLYLTRYKEAQLHCPHCDAVPSLDIEHRQWVEKNPDTGSDVVGFQIQPFDAPRVITIPDLVKASTGFKRWADFVNFGLGLPCEDRETSFTKEELERLFVMAGRFTPYASVMGIDVGVDCHILIGVVGIDGQMDIVHAELVPVGLLEARKAQLKAQYKVRVTVMDSQPYFDLLMRLQKGDKNLWGSVYSNTKGLDVYSTTIREEDPEKGRPQMRQVDLNRNKALDTLMDYVRGNSLGVLENGFKGSIIAHLQDMKRVKTFTEDNELVFVWQKSSKGADHWHHTLLYTYIASRLLATVAIDEDMPFVFQSLKLKQHP